MGILDSFRCLWLGFDGCLFSFCWFWCYIWFVICVALACVGFDFGVCLLMDLVYVYFGFGFGVFRVLFCLFCDLVCLVVVVCT